MTLIDLTLVCAKLSFIMSEACSSSSNERSSDSNESFGLSSDGFSSSSRDSSVNQQHQENGHGTKVLKVRRVVWKPNVATHLFSIFGRAPATVATNFWWEVQNYKSPHLPPCWRPLSIHMQAPTRGLLPGSSTLNHPGVWPPKSSGFGNIDPLWPFQLD